MADRQVAQLGPGTACCGWNHCGRRLAAGAIDGSVSVYDFQPSPSSRWQAHEHAIVNVVWLPPDYGDAIACVCADGALSLWEEVAEDDQLPTWRKCKVFEGGNSHILNVQFGLLLSSLKMVTAYSDGQVKVYELLNSLELDKWQLQAELQNITDPVSRNGKPACISASIAWSPRRGEGQQASFAVGFNSDSPYFNSCKIWEFEQAHQRWLPLIELGSAEDKGDRVHSVAWAPNIGRPYEIIAVATCKGIAVWHVGFNPESDGRLSTENVAVLPGHNGEVWQLEWDMGGMTLASTGGDGMVKLWQANLNGVWHEQAVLDCNGSHD
ncbi:protein SEH1-like [Lolium rigidum]|uniref:protein SEH1-like n=1 Tax=Lolium rigidum TaxID=89674 RepID=UPI001F5DDF0E|nr:protein SEH1-like [Lolium rigidum]